MLLDPNNAGHWQELDFVDNYGGFEQDVYTGIHTAAASNANWQRNLQVYSELTQPRDYHTYGMKWNPATQNDPNNNADLVGPDLCEH